ncbi:MAG: 3'-5' exonuclease [Acidobacteriota bacterium]
MRTTPPDHYLVVDFEATCDDRGTVPRHEMEIIEIGAVRVDGTTLEPIDDFAAFIRPVRHPRLTEFCHGLTTITQEQVDAAPSFPAVAESLRAWVEERPGRAVFSSWGDYDRKQLAQDCAFHSVASPLPEEHVNLKALFAERRGLRRGVGMGKALRMMDLPLEGTHHRGIDDARNIARLLPAIVGEAR